MITPLTATPDAQTNWETLRERVHPRCVVCSPSNPRGLGQRFRLRPDGGVETTFDGSPALEGYAGLLHGGIAATLLDGAMTHCLFAHGLHALTAELILRYHHPVTAQAPMTVRAWLAHSQGRLHALRAELLQGEQLKVSARAKFVTPPA